MSRRLSRRRRRVVAAAIRPERPYPPPDHRQQMLAATGQALAVWLAQQAAQGLLAVLLRVMRGH